MSYTIYLIENEVNGKQYVGMTSWTPEERFQRHVWDSEKQTGYTLHLAIQKYGPESFDVDPIDDAETKQEALELEEEWIERLDTHHGEGYNDTAGGEDPPHYAGAQNHKTSLTEEEVLEVRQRYVNDDSLTGGDLANEYGVAEKAMAEIIAGRTWSHLAVPDGMEAAIARTGAANNLRGGDKPNTILDEDEVWEMRRRYVENDDLRDRDFAEEYGMERGSISQIMTGESWPHVPVPEGMEEARRRARYSGNRQLTNEQVVEIRRRYDEEDVAQHELAEDYDTEQGHVSNLVRGKRRTEVGGPIQ